MHAHGSSVQDPSRGLHDGRQLQRRDDSPYALRPETAPYQAASVERTFMAAVYRWMTLGLVVTAVIAFVTAEESGLLGSEFLGLNPVVPTEDLVANLNVDGGNWMS